MSWSLSQHTALKPEGSESLCQDLQKALAQSLGTGTALVPRGRTLCDLVGRFQISHLWTAHFR